jgi:hypothetical protein
MTFRVFVTKESKTKSDIPAKADHIADLSQPISLGPLKVRIKPNDRGLCEISVTNLATTVNRDSMIIRKPMEPPIDVLESFSRRAKIFFGIGDPTNEKVTIAHGEMITIRTQTIDEIINLQVL